MIFPGLKGSLNNPCLLYTSKEFNLTVVYGADVDVATIINAAKRYPMTVSYTHLDVDKRQYFNVADNQWLGMLMNNRQSAQ